MVMDSIGRLDVPPFLGEPFINKLVNCFCVDSVSRTVDLKEFHKYVQSDGQCFFVGSKYDSRE